MSDNIKYSLDELVDVSIRGVRVISLEGADPDSLVVSVPAPGTVDGPYFVGIPLGVPAVTVTRVAPPEWPPQLGDIWADRDDREWIATDSDDETVLMRGIETGSLLDALDVLGSYGPVRLVRRRGWTPPQPSAAEAQGDEPIGAAAGLRLLADWFDEHPQIVMRYASIGWAADNSRGDAAAIAEVHAVAAALGVEVAQRIHGSGLWPGHRSYRAERKFGPVQLHVSYIEEKPAAADEPEAGPQAAAQALLAFVRPTEPGLEPYGADVPAEMGGETP